MEIPKYALIGTERKMRVDAALLPSLDALPFALIFDRYLDGGRLRLRRIEKTGETQYKLCKKYGHISPHEEPITNLYLSREEYHSLHILPGRDLNKRRTYFEWQGVRFAIDTFFDCALVLCECEAQNKDALNQIVFPLFCVEDVSDDARYEGAFLAGSNGPARPRKSTLLDKVNETGLI